MKTTRCSVDGCGRVTIARGMCPVHYRRMREHGTTDLPIRSITAPAERLAARLVRMPNGCLEWTGTTAHGYGRIWVNDALAATHRLAWELVNGPIPEGIQVLHHCDNPPCCETEPSDEHPDGHLFLGTIADNSADMAAKGRAFNGRASLTHCKRGHLFDETNTHVNPKTGARNCRMCRAARTRSRHRGRRSVSLV